eukprot:2742611-Rhodomonas_salina.2
MSGTDAAYNATRQSIMSGTDAAYHATRQSIMSGTDAAYDATRWSSTCTGMDAASAAPRSRKSGSGPDSLPPSRYTVCGPAIACAA